MTALRLREATVEYGGRGRGGAVRALSEVSLAVERGERVALVGRSGAGKSTVARLAAGLVAATAGSVEVLGRDLSTLSRRELRGLRRRVHLVFQDPYQSLHPGLRVGEIVAEPLAIAGVARDERRQPVVDALEQVGLTPARPFVDRHPGSLSGGQRQRVAIARMLVARPELILADEPASMLDASLRATVVTQLLAIRSALDAGLVFITHDLALARHIADRILVLDGGRLVEEGPTEQILTAPRRAETAALIEAAAPDLEAHRGGRRLPR